MSPRFLRLKELVQTDSSTKGLTPRRRASAKFCSDKSLVLRACVRAKDTLISAPRFSTPCEMRFFPRDKGETAFVEGFSLKRPFSLSRVGKITSRRG